MATASIPATMSNRCFSGRRDPSDQEHVKGNHANGNSDAAHQGLPSRMHRGFAGGSFYNLLSAWWERQLGGMDENLKTSLKQKKALRGIVWVESGELEGKAVELAEAETGLRVSATRQKFPDDFPGILAR